MRQGEPGEAERLRVEAKNLDKRGQRDAEDNPMYAEHCRRRAAWCRKLARDEDDFAEQQ